MTVFTWFDSAKTWIDDPSNTRTVLWIMVGAVVAVACVELLADFLLKKWAVDHRRVGLLIGGMLVYCLVGCLYGSALLLGDLTIANSIWQVLSVVSVTFLGVVVFKERPTVGQWTGVAVITLGLLIMLTGSPGLIPVKTVWNDLASKTS